MIHCYITCFFTVKKFFKEIIMYIYFFTTEIFLFSYLVVTPNWLKYGPYRYKTTLNGTDLSRNQRVNPANVLTRFKFRLYEGMTC